VEFAVSPNQVKQECVFLDVDRCILIIIFSGRTDEDGVMSVNDEENESVSRFDGEEHHGWSPDVGSGGSERATEANEKAFGTPSGDAGSGAEESSEERSGVPPTDTTAETPLGVGTSITTSAEDRDDGDGETQGRKGASQRPYGTSHDPDETGVGSGEPKDQDSPDLPPGDQGG
jgi:hypothetical protein